MIGKLTGIVDAIYEDHVVLDVNGVGYVAYCAQRTLSGLPGRGERASLFIETLVREDLIRLYGFATEEERGWFRLLQGVQGVGSKVALAVLSTLSVNELSAAIATQDRATIARAPGVGPRVAQRIAGELKDKIPAGMGFGLAPAAAGGPAGNGEAAVLAGSDRARDAVSALVNLGYSQMQAGQAVARLLQAEPEADLATLIRKGLKELSA